MISFRAKKVETSDSWGVVNTPISFVFVWSRSAKQEGTLLLLEGYRGQVCRDKGVSKYVENIWNVELEEFKQSV